MDLSFPIFIKRMRKLASEGFTYCKSLYEVSSTIQVPGHTQYLVASTAYCRPQEIGQGRGEGPWGHSDAEETVSRGLGVWGLGSAPAWAPSPA